MTQPRIHNRGRGPEIEGTRITVYDILAYRAMHWDNSRIADWLRLSVEEVACAQEYIDAHQDEVERNYRRNLERVAQGHPPELQAKIDERHEYYKILWKDRIEKSLGVHK